MKVVLIDAYDSFVYIISQYLRTLGLETLVLRNDTENLGCRVDEYNPSFLVLGPGPGHPSDCGYVDLIRKFEHVMPILGVCLGHQAIGLAYGESVVRAGNPRHGKTSVISNDGMGVYRHTNKEPFTATRYHSLIIDSNMKSDELCVTSRDQTDNYIMGVRHRDLPIEGVQFHPESILTQGGINIFRSFIQEHV